MLTVLVVAVMVEGNDREVGEAAVVGMIGEKERDD